VIADPPPPMGRSPERIGDPPLDLSLFTVEQQALFRKLLEIALAGAQPTQTDEKGGT
jgi:hypothetical protein